MESEIKPYPRITAAIRDGDLQELKKLFEKYPDFISLDVPGFGSWLIYASAHGNSEIVKYLISIGFEINATDKRNEQSPLEAACSKGNEDIVDFLLKSGASLDVSNSNLNPLFSSVIGKSTAIAEKLINAGVDTTKKYVSETDANLSVDAIAFAMMNGQREIARLIARKNYDGDESAVEAALAEGLATAERLTVRPPVK